MKLTDADKLMPLFIEKAHKMPDKHGVKLGEDWLLDYNDIKDVIDNAPPVEVDKLILIMARRNGKLAMMLNALRPHGKWIKDENGIDRCSECGNRCITFVMGKPSDKFCIECGADMRKEADND